MNRLDLPYICTVMGDLSGIPIRLYQGDEEILFHFSVPLPADPMRLCRDEIWAITRNVGYCMTEDLSFFALVRSGERRIILGPTRQISSTEQELRELAFRLDVPREEIQAFFDGMKSIARMPFESILQMLCVVNHLLNCEKLSVRDIMISDAEQQALKQRVETVRSRRAFPSTPSEAAPTPVQHNTMALEETVMDIVRRGNTAALREWLARAPAVRGGTLAAEQLRQRKNLFIVTATLVSRAAIRGGMEVEDALSLSDRYIQGCELMRAPDRIANLQYQMLLEYTERVERIRHGHKATKLAVTVANYVQHHLSEPITVEAIARELFLSRPYLSRKFKEETGETLTDFILKEKTEEAKRLLRYTEKTATAIGTYLGFSSPGHFSRVFKKYTGIHPGEYRARHGRT